MLRKKFYITVFPLRTENLVVPGARNVRGMDFLWVRWFGKVPDYCSGFRRAHLPVIGFIDSTDKFAFSFVDPANVVHGDRKSVV